MTKERIEELMEKGYITRVASADALATMTEEQLIEKGYITQVGIFDGSDDTVEVLEQEVEQDDVVDTPTPDDPVGGDEPTVDPEVDPEGNDDDEPTAPIVDEGGEE